MMMKLLSKWISSAQLLILLLASLITYTDASQPCHFDALRPQHVPSSDINYSRNSEPFREQETLRHRGRRQASLDEHFAPIRVASFFYEMDLKSDEKEELKSIIRNSVVQIENIFSVIRVSGPLLLNRTGCRRTYLMGNNAGRCNFIERGYSGEMCADEFQIPDDHLRGLFLWDSSNPDPVRTVFHEGHGINGTDFVLYAQSISSSRCDSDMLNIVAYATYCQLDQNGRPIAAYINICPQMISNKSNKVSVTVLHELFHALGFSSTLFNRFKRCFLAGDGSVTCNSRIHPVYFNNGAERLMTDRVAEMTSRHLNCSMNQTAKLPGAILQTERGEVMSHWDAAFLQGSLMMPTISQPHLMFIDNITLALFEDSGWYRVNYNYAQDLRWGKGEGCDFGLDSNCQDQRSPFFCQQSGAIGCHYLHRDKGRCTTNPFLHGCRIYDPQPEDDSCLKERSSDVYSTSGESFGPASRCFRTNLSREVGEDTLMQPLVGHCLQHRCNATNHLFVAVEGGNWVFCPAGTLLQVAGLRGVIECPMEHVLCDEPWPIASSTSHPFLYENGSSSTVSNDKGTSDNVLSLEMLFDSLPAMDNDYNKSKELEEILRQRIHMTLATQDNAWNISNVTLNHAGNVVQFSLTNSNHQSNNDLLAVGELLRREVDAGNFSFSFSGSLHTAKAFRLLFFGDGSKTIPTTSLPALSTVSQFQQSHIVASGLVSAIAIGSVVGFAIVTIIVVVFIRCCLTRQRKNNQSLSTETTVQASVV